MPLSSTSSFAALLFSSFFDLNWTHNTENFNISARLGQKANFHQIGVLHLVQNKVEGNKTKQNQKKTSTTEEMKETWKSAERKWKANNFVI